VWPWMLELGGNLTAPWRGKASRAIPCKSWAGRDVAGPGPALRMAVLAVRQHALSNLLDVAMLILVRRIPMRPKPLVHCRQVPRSRGGGGFPVWGARWTQHGAFGDCRGGSRIRTPVFTRDAGHAPAGVQLQSVVYAAALDRGFTRRLPIVDRLRLLRSKMVTVPFWRPRMRRTSFTGEQPSHGSSGRRKP